MRLRNASFSEVFCRVRQMVVSVYLKWSFKLGFRVFRTTEIKKAEIGNLSLPDLVTEPGNITLRGLNAYEFSYLYA